MFAGHYGVGTGAKAADRWVPLWVLFVAVQVLDIAWAILILADVEKARVAPGITDASDFDFTYYPYSHSLEAALGWSLLAYLAVRFAAPAAWRSSRAALVVAAAVFSHWPLDLIVHRSDLGLWGNSAKVGLDLWSSAVATFVVELLLVAAGLWLYLRVTEATSAVGRWSPWLLAALLGVLAIFTVFGSSSDVDGAAITGLVSYIVLPALAWLVERRRRPRGVQPVHAGAERARRLRPRPVGGP